MRLLVLGGTAWLGGRVVRDALARGHDVTMVARGASGPPVEGARFVRADREEPGAHAAVPGEYDACVDVTRHPGQVRRAVVELGQRLGHYVLVSTGNVYADHSVPGADETGALLPALTGDRMDDMETYGEAKVACEEAAREHASWLIARVGLIGGPGDRSGRSGYWPWRFAHPGPGGSVLVPDDPELPSQLIDVRDLAAWLVTVAESRTRGVFDAVGPRSTLGAMLAKAREAAGHEGPLVPVTPQWLAAHGVAPWMGPRSLPLWLDDPEWRAFADRSGEAARSVGLTHRPLAETLRDAATTYAELDSPAAGLSDADHEELLVAARRD